MQWTAEMVEQIPEVYRDFLLYLRPIITSRHEVLKFEGFLLGTIAGALYDDHDFEFPQYSKIADNLKKAGLVEEDEHGFFRPTPKGEELIGAIVAMREPIPVGVPPLPNFSE